MNKPFTASFNPNILYIGCASTYFYIKEQVNRLGYEMNGLSVGYDLEDIQSHLDKYCPGIVYIKKSEELVGCNIIINYIKNNYMDAFIVLEDKDDINNTLAHHVIEYINREQIIKVLHLSKEYQDKIHNYHLLEKELPLILDKKRKRTKI